MNRKDTIIVAVLINAGLLIVLFVSALKQDPNAVASREDKPQVQQKLASAPKKEATLAKSTPDQVDQLLAQYSKKIVKETPKEPVKEVVKEPVKEEKKQEPLAIKEETVKPFAKPQVEKEVIKKEAAKKPSTHEELIKVVVKKGDVLEKIAKIYGTTVGALMQENQLTDSRLQIGQVLAIPKEKEHKVSSAISVVPLEEKFYIVKNGDNLWKIAIENHMKVEELLQLNQLTEKQAKALRPGDRLRIQ
jgi:peptidoglycan endopeptidase LytF